jgi:hypothetical protein
VNSASTLVQPAAGRWRALHPAQLAESLAALRVPWWIAGGWALDLFLGSQSRPHADLDVGVLRRDALQVLAALSSWEIFEARDGMLTRLQAGVAPAAGVNSLWCRPADAGDWMFELMLDDCEDDRWVFRRDRRIQRPLALAVRRDRAGIPFLAPEVQLLYKARPLRMQDRADFERVAPRLDPGARTWLRGVLGNLYPDHEWLLSTHLVDAAAGPG